MKKIWVFSFFIIIIFSIFFYSKRPKQNNLNNPVIFNKKIGLISLKDKTENQEINIGLMGDLNLGRYITTIARRKNDFGWSFSKVSNWLQQNDFNFANLEGPIIKNCPEGKFNTFIFCGDTRFLPYLKENKFIFNLANNHIFNYGKSGFEETKNLLIENNINFIYSDDSQKDFFIKEINSLKIGFLGFDLVTNKTEQSTIISLVKKYNKEVDWLIVSLHWGNEYLSKPEQWQINFAHQLIDSGADIIAGHHSHVFQSEEIYKNKLIFYSLGNFIFDQNWSRPTSSSKMIKLTLSKVQILKTEFVPIEIKFDSRPEIIN